MKFLIGRASNRPWRGSDKPPCKGATPEPPDKYGNRRWAIEIPDLAALMMLCDKDGEIVVSAPSLGHVKGQPDDLPFILIYDDYIE